MRAKKNLNEIEAMKMAEIIKLNKYRGVYYIDCPQLVSEKRAINKFKERILKYLNKEPKLVVENYLDEKMPVVSAASIIAKVERDRAIEKIKKRVGFDFGNGYPHDERAVEYVKTCVLKGNPSLYIRWRWDTTQRIVNELLNDGFKIKRGIMERVGIEPSLQRKLKEFFLKKLNCC